MGRSRSAAAIRRDAEKAAQEHLKTTMLGVVGELADAQAILTTAHDAVEQARVEGQQLIADATAKAQRLVGAAQESTTTSEQRYSQAWEQAVQQGWSGKALQELGYAKPPTAQRANKKERKGEKPAPAAPVVSLPLEPAPSEHPQAANF